MRGSIGRVRTGAEILRDENAWMNSYHQPNLSQARTMISPMNAALKLVVEVSRVAESDNPVTASLREYMIAISIYLSDP